jgi:ATP-binding cassette subfamily C (CFTR/MRP) protein 1
VKLQLGVLVILRIVLLLLWSIRPPIQTRTSIAASSVFLLESFAFAFVTRSEHVHSVRPSSLLSLYYLFSLGLDFIRMRTLIEVKFDALIIALSAADMAIKTSLLFSEAQNKRAYFSNSDLERPPQEIGGIFSRSVFWWLNSLFLQGD